MTRRARVDFGSRAARRRLVAEMAGAKPAHQGIRPPRAIVALVFFLAILSAALHASATRGSLPNGRGIIGGESLRAARPDGPSREVDDMRARRLIGAALVVAGVVTSAHGVDRLVPEQYRTIQSAVDAAGAGDVVSVASGIYTESVDLRGKAITLSSRIPLGAQLRAPGDVRSIRAISGETASTRITGFRLIGNQLYGGGILVTGSSPLIDRCSFQGVRNATGGGLLVNGGSPWIEFCDFVGCIADVPVSGFGSGGAIRIVNGTVIIADCTFENNAGPTNAAGIMNESGSVSILRCTFGPHHPMASIVYNGDSGNMLIEDCVFENDSSTTRGAICFSWGSRVIRRCTFRDLSFVNGGAIQSSGGHTVVQDCSFARVTSTGTASGVAGTSWATFAVGGSSFCGMSPTAISVAYQDLGGNTFASSCVPPCPADIVDDGSVNGADLATVLVYWGTNGSQFPGVDVDGSGGVDGSDLAVVLAAWGPCPQ